MKSRRAKTSGSEARRTAESYRREVTHLIVPLGLVSTAVLVTLAASVHASELAFGGPDVVAGFKSGGAIATLAVDLDRDGVPELVTTATKNSSDPHFRIHRFEGDSWLVINVLSSAQVSSRADRFGGALAAADIDGDGWVDLVVPESPNGAGNAKVSVFRNPASSGITASWPETVIARWPDPSVTGQPQDARHMAEIAAGDLDGDGDIDVVTRDVDHGVFVLENDGGVFRRHFIAANPREGLDLFDPDGDGDLDILLNGIWLEAPDTGPGFTTNLSDTANYQRHDIKADKEAASPWYPPSNSGPEKDDYASKVLAVDLDGDGLEDVVITNAEELRDASSTDSKPKGLWVYRALDATGDRWQKKVLQDKGFDLHNLAAADVDGDGDLDLLSGTSRVGLGESPPEVVVFRNEGWGGAWTREKIASLNIYSGVLADLDGDGRPDILGPDNWNSGPLRWFPNETISAPEPLAGPWAALGILGWLAHRRLASRTLPAGRNRHRTTPG